MSSFPEDVIATDRDWRAFGLLSKLTEVRLPPFEKIQAIYFDKTTSKHFRTPIVPWYVRYGRPASAAARMRNFFMSSLASASPCLRFLLVLGLSSSYVVFLMLFRVLRSHNKFLSPDLLRIPSLLLTINLVPALPNEFLPCY